VICPIVELYSLNILDTLRILFSLVMLSYASWVDMKTREIYDIVWLFFGGIGLIIAVYEVYTGILPLVWLALPILFSGGVSIALSYFGLFGGADVGAFITLSILHPIPPRGLIPFLGIVSVVYPLTLFSNSALSGASFSLVLLVRNLIHALKGRSIFEGLKQEPLWRKLVVMGTGLRVEICSVRGPPFQYPLEHPGEDGASKRLIIMPDIQDDEAATDTFKRLAESGSEEVWVSHTLPFLVFIMIGYIVALTLGDIALFLLRLFFLGRG
jgi:preflagellin peptidase FlaK